MLMMEVYEHANLLIISASTKFAEKIGVLFQKEGFLEYTCVRSIGEGKRILIDLDVDLLIIDAPMPLEDATQFAIELARNRSFDYSIIMLANAEIYEKNLYQAERLGIVTFKKPMDPRLLLQTMRLLLSMHVKIKRLENKADKLRQKLEDDHVISRAKILLVANLKMSEADAHHYIEKRAMDACVKKTKIAKEIIALYESK